MLCVSQVCHAVSRCLKDGSFLRQAWSKSQWTVLMGYLTTLTTVRRYQTHHRWHFFSFRKIAHRCIVCVTQFNWVKYVIFVFPRFAMYCRRTSYLRWHSKATFDCPRIGLGPSLVLLASAASSTCGLVNIVECSAVVDDALLTPLRIRVYPKQLFALCESFVEHVSVREWKSDWPTNVFTLNNNWNCGRVQLASD